MLLEEKIMILPIVLTFLMLHYFHKAISSNLYFVVDVPIDNLLNINWIEAMLNRNSHLKSMSRSY